MSPDRMPLWEAPLSKLTSVLAVLVSATLLLQHCTDAYAHELALALLSDGSLSACRHTAYSESKFREVLPATSLLSPA